MGTADIHKKAKVARKRTIKKIRSESKRVLIACEDTKSSRYYFEKMIKDYGLNGKVTFAKHIGTNPMKVLEAIKEHLKIDSNFDEKWIVIDKDSYSKHEFNGAIASAKALDVKVAYANESYELWILLHLQNQTAPINRINLTKKLKSSSLNYEKNNAFIYEEIKDRQEQAIHRAKKLVRHFESINGKLDPYMNNPLTSIYELVESLSSKKKIS